MSMKKIAAVCLTMALAGGALTACGGTTTANNTNNTNTAAATVDASSVKELTMSYITPADTQKQLMNDEYVIVDVRKAADFATAHIPGAINADMDKAKDGDNADGLKVMEEALVAATGSKDGNGKTLVFVCYSGKRYAQAATNVAGALGCDPSKMVTLEGGMKAWEEAFAKGTVPGEVKTSGTDVAMTQFPVADAATKTADAEYVFVDVRKAADFATAHIENAVSADLDAAKGGATQDGAEKLAKALLAATGSVDGNGKTIVLVCYSGKSYAQCGTNILSAMEVPADKVVTLEGGMKAWTEAGNATVQ